MENNQLPEEMITAIRDTLDCNPKFQGSVVSVNQMVMLMVGCVVVFGIIFLCSALPENWNMRTSKWLIPVWVAEFAL